MYEIICTLGLSNYCDSIHYHDSLQLFMNKIVDCLTIQIVISYKIYRKCNKTFMKSECEVNDTWKLHVPLSSIMIFMNWNTYHTNNYCDSIHNCE